MVLDSSRQPEAIAIIGMGCRFPGGAHDIDSYWQILERSVDAIRPIPEERWRAADHYDPDPEAPGKMFVREGGFLECPIDEFDAQFFGISPREAEWMDPQQRLFLEVAWEALEDAGINPDKLNGSFTGVFVGVSSNDYGFLLSKYDRSEDQSIFRITSSVPHVIAGRLAYLLGLMGPCWAVDAACASSLVAVHNACSSLLNGEADCAIAAGVHLMITPEHTINYCKASVLSPDGRCKTFDASADGFSRGEGCGVVVLKRLADAQRDGDRILSVIRSSAVLQDGVRNGLTVPNAVGQETLIRRALELAKLSPSSIDYVEAHGTGTSIGDPTEAEALVRVFQNRPASLQPLYIGSCKTNLGHLEAASGMAGLIKTVLCLQKEAIPPHLHLQKPNPAINWQAIPAAVPTSMTSWPKMEGRVRRAGVSSFGASGTIAHLILEEAPYPVQSGETEPQDDRTAHVVTMSARTPEALEQLQERFLSHAQAHPGQKLADLAYSANTGRARHEHRLSVVARDLDDFRSKLTARDYRSGTVATGTEKPKIAFLFSGQGFSLDAEMGRELYRTSPVFREAIDECAVRFSQYDEEFSLLDSLYGTNPMLSDVVYSHSCLFALQYALGQLWQSFGVVPHLVLGHSLGEYAAAVIAGAMKVETALDLIVARGRLTRQHPNGTMLAVQAPWQRVEELLKAIPDFEIACINSPTQTVVAGSLDRCDDLISLCQKQAIQATRLPIYHAFHSGNIEPVKRELLAAANRAEYEDLRLPLISSITADLVAPEGINAEYWANNTRAVVKFQQAIEKAMDEGCNTFVELGPQPQLITFGMDCQGDRKVQWLPSMRRGEAPWVVLLESIARLYVSGAAIDWLGFESFYERRKVSLPTYPWQRERYWLEILEKAEEQVCQLVAKFPKLDSAAVVKEVEGILAHRHVAELLSDEQGMQNELVPLCHDYICRALERLGWKPRIGDTFEVDALCKDLRIIDRHRRYVEYCLTRLIEAGILKKTGQLWSVVCWPSLDDLEQHHKDILDRYPDFSIELTLLKRSADHLHLLWSGGQDPLSLLFPAPPEVSLEDVYYRAPYFKLANKLLREILRSIIPKFSGQGKLRILEVGAGTGGTTNLVLPELSAERCEYVFTDVSPLFLERARQRFSQYPFMQFERFDLECNPKSQGFSANQFDVVIAANVIHATRSVRESIRSLQQLLSPGGFILALEPVASAVWLDVAFGSLEGWWHFNDFDLRPDHLFLASSKWTKLMKDEGFESVEVITLGSGTQQAVIVGQADSQSVVLQYSTLQNSNSRNRKPGPSEKIEPELERAEAQEQTAVLRARIAELERHGASAERIQVLKEYLEHQVRKILKWPANKNLHSNQSLFDLGIDSLMAVELSNRIQSDLGGPAISAIKLYEYPSVDCLSEYVETQLRGDAAKVVNDPDAQQMVRQNELARQSNR